MEIIKTSLAGVMIVRPQVFRDDRGFLLETHHKSRYRDMVTPAPFVQDNMSFSQYGTIRGLHYQIVQPQAKLIQVIKGKILDIAVDIRKGSPNFGKYIGIYLSDKTPEQIFIPEGFAHGFCVLSEDAYVIYKCTDFYCPDGERGVLWSDPDLNIDWPVTAPTLSPKDANYPLLKDLPDKDLPS